MLKHPVVGKQYFRRVKIISVHQTEKTPKKIAEIIQIRLIIIKCIIIFKVKMWSKRIKMNNAISSYLNIWLNQIVEKQY